MAEFTCLKIRHRDSTITDRMFVAVAAAGREMVSRRRIAMSLEDRPGARAEMMEPMRIGPRHPVSDSLDGEPLLKAICDWDFMMAMNKALRSVSSGGVADVVQEQPATVMSDNGFLPAGIVRDATFGVDALYVLVRRNAHEPSQPFLPVDLWNKMQNFLNLHEETRRRLPVVLVWIPADTLKIAINHIYFQTPIKAEEAEPSVTAAKAPLSVDVHAGDDDAIRQARSWIRDAISRHASDIHFEPMEPSGRIRIRVNGNLEYLARNVSHRMMAQVVTWVKAQAGMDISDSRRPLDGSLRIAYTDSGTSHSLDVRVSVIPVVSGPKMVLRLLNPDELGGISRRGLEGAIWDPALRGRFINALSTRDGIVLVTGPTGSGKTTTLNVSLLHLLRPDVYGDTRNIVTIEDPVEYVIPGANQTQVNEAAGMTFASTLRSLLRQDPDVMLVGEIRDGETAKIAVQAALTGHLILATLHTNDALGSVARLHDLGISPFLIASTLRLVQAQRLVHRFCPECGGRPENIVTADALRVMVSHSRLKSFLPTLSAPTARIYRPAGCVRCSNGYSGRIAVMEMAASSPELVAAIEERVPSRELEQVARAHSGFRSMVENGVDMITHGVTSLQEIESISLAAES